VIVVPDGTSNTMLAFVATLPPDAAAQLVALRAYEPPDTSLLPSLPGLAV
jgi:hypothetical protein